MLNNLLMKTSQWIGVVFSGIWLATASQGAELAASAAVTTNTPVPLTHAHAHNDYEHKRPLLDALDNGFCSIEADIFLVDGQLLVGHSKSQLRPERTLKALYLEPLRAQVRKNQGRVYAGGPMCWLFIDPKTEAEATYQVLETQLKEYAEMLTRFEKDRTVTNAITVVITGNRPRATLAAQSVRLAACDGLWADVASDVSPQLIPIVSEQWTANFKWRGVGEMPAEDRAKLADILKQAHARGRLMRFWAAPDKPAAWQALYDSGVDLINTDDLPGMKSFLLKQKTP